MNAILQKFARDWLKSKLKECSPAQTHIFKRMYVIRNGHGAKIEIDAANSATIEEVVDKMPSEKLDWAMQQIERTIEKNEESDQKNG